MGQYAAEHLSGAQEGEILLSPSHRFTVSSEPREEGGYTFIDLVQMAGNTFVS